jgi:hypothetical protein
MSPPLDEAAEKNAKKRKRKRRKGPPLSREERAEVSRQNGARSRGPRTPEGRRRSSANAFKHGQRAEVLAMDGEM